MTTKPLLLVCGVVLLFATAGCGGSEVKPVPDVAGERLDVAQDELDDLGLGYEVIGGGVFGVVVRSHWQVCEQHPGPGGRAKSVHLVIARSCGEPQPAGGVPDVTGLRLDVAERELGERGLEYYVYAGDEVIIRSNWTVCGQYPEPGGRPAEVDLYVEHFFCDDDD
ncbi:MAG TPA: PASTA domain-containing protein [Gaiellaceae bacterium]|jgi:beta-lactam-binding protein with PASTA domain|nr:PASTA domain-containing protein [Gaiellaceae bacterium]